jgi:transcription antitermination factor NusB
MKKRRLARELSLQALYSIELSGEDAGKVLSDLEREAAPDADTWEYAVRLTREVAARMPELNERIRKQCDNWELERVAVLDRNILRMAIAEILWFDDIPPKVSIDEAIELAKKFSTEKSGTFINGILDPIAFKEKKEINPKKETNPKTP